MSRGDAVAVTMRDVARHAGVSPKTVSNVMNGYPYIREETRIKVLASIDALGYQMNIRPEPEVRPDRHHRLAVPS